MNQSWLTLMIYGVLNEWLATPDLYRQCWCNSHQAIVGRNSWRFCLSVVFDMCWTMFKLTVKNCVSQTEALWVLQRSPDSCFRLVTHVAMDYTCCYRLCLLLQMQVTGRHLHAQRQLQWCCFYYCGDLGHNRWNRPWCSDWNPVPAGQKGKSSASSGCACSVCSFCYEPMQEQHTRGSHDLKVAREIQRDRDR